MREETTGWRDEQISRRHRQYGINVPAVDVDFLLIEYDTGKPKALIDYKLHSSPLWDSERANKSAMGSLYDEHGQQIPFFIVRYDPDGWIFHVYGRNPAATAFLERLNCVDGQRLAEFHYVRFLYILRGREMPALDLFANQLQT